MQDDRLSKRLKTEYKPVTWANHPVQIDAKGSTGQLAAWRKATIDSGFAPIEFLLPSVQATFVDRLPDSMQAAEEAYARNPGALEKLLEHRWGYYFYLGGGYSTKSREHGEADGRAHAIMRVQSINDVVAQLYGRDLKGKTLLDMACNWGGMGIDMATRGCRVTGFDIRQENVDKARDLIAYLGTPDIEVRQSDILDLTPVKNGTFDVVYNLGLMYHLTQPIEAMEITYALCNEIAVVDTNCSREAFSGFAQIQVGNVNQPDHARGARRLELKPTYRAVIDMMLAVGFKDLIEVTLDLKDFPHSPSRHVLETYNRRRIIGFK
ncbi:class I SAM-dependent methyltransferase [Methylocystis sp. WRRC1]|uniref:class I SAM-dependent methyltransferase n=1 Tax=Methylocystis sp. WRRC1 TaxID=1732014 RepID=UPI001D140F1D|nr:class I SAM-dependent methyltransferase [Methylocystis sp. WRRC1]MCC3245466.1 class I SAM-dependent methyltransferase [Methylocystis sp. WRRC1]